ncbi:MAG: DNA polymerase III subunit delta' [Burkholderiales bacterium]
MTLLPWQESLWKSIVTQPLPSALLLSGREGIGKLAFAHALAQRTLCDTAEACGECQSCRWLASGVHPDFHFIEPKQEEAEKKGARDIKVDQIRDLAGKAILASARTKVFVLHPAESMNANAQNALLKILEEPPGETLFILVNHRPQRLLPTVVSRCRRLNMPEADAENALAWLTKQEIEQPQLALAAAGGAPLIALRLSEQREARKLFMTALNRSPNSVALAQTWQKFDVPQVVNWLQQWTYDLMLRHHQNQPRYNLDYEAELSAIARKIGPRAILSLQRELFAARRAAEHSLNPALFIEQLSLSYWRHTQNG